MVSWSNAVLNSGERSGDRGVVADEVCLEVLKKGDGDVGWVGKVL